MINRRVSDGNFTSQPPAQYDSIEPQPESAADRRIGNGGFTGQPPAHYDTIGAQPNSNTAYSVIDKPRRVSDSNFTTKPPERPPRPEDETAYSVIDRPRRVSENNTTRQPSDNTSQSAVYSVIDKPRRASDNSMGIASQKSDSVPAVYSVISRPRRVSDGSFSGQISTHESKTSRKHSGVFSPQSSVSENGYSKISRSSTGTAIVSPKRDNLPSSADSPPPLPPPPLYSSVVDVGGAGQPPCNGDTPLYHTLQDVEESGLETKGGAGLVDENSIYHTISDPLT